MKFSLVILCSLISWFSSISGQAFAGDLKSGGWYLAAAGGWDHIHNGDTSSSATIAGALVTANGSTAFNDGGVALAAVGKSFGPLRSELEIGIRENDIESIRFDNVTLLGITIPLNTSVLATGSARTTSVMANVAYDLPTKGRFTPFLIGGLGLAVHTLDVDSIDGIASTFEEDDTVIAYQLGAGVSTSLTDNASVNMQYRYFGSQNAKHNDNTDLVTMNHVSHSVLIGIKFDFN